MRVSELIEQLSQINPDAYVTSGIDVDMVTDLEANPENPLTVTTDAHGVVTLWGHLHEEGFEYVEKGDLDILEDEKNEEINSLTNENESLADAVGRGDRIIRDLEAELADLKAEMADRHEV